MKKVVFSIFAFLLAVLIILWLTVMTPEETVNLTNSASSVLAKFLGEGSWALLHIRKLAHIPEYFLLGVTAALLMKNIRRPWIYSILLCMSISIMDQLVKTQVPGRHWDATDFPFDAAGYLLGIALVWVYLRWDNRSR